MKQTTNETRERNQGITESGISRRDALKTAGKYAALTSATLMLVLTPRAHAQVSEPGAPGPFQANDQEGQGSEITGADSDWWLP